MGNASGSSGVRSTLAVKRHGGFVVVPGDVGRVEAAVAPGATRLTATDLENPFE